MIHLNRALEIYQNMPDADSTINLRSTFCAIGQCHNDLHHYNAALTNLTRALDINRNKSLTVDKDRYLGEIYLEMGRCLTGLKNSMILGIVCNKH